MNYSFSHNIIYKSSAAFFIADREVTSVKVAFSQPIIQLSLLFIMILLVCHCLARRPDMKAELDWIIFVEILLLSCFFQETRLILFSIPDGCIKFFTDITYMVVYWILSCETTFTDLFDIVYSIAFGVSSNKKWFNHIPRLSLVLLWCRCWVRLMASLEIEVKRILFVLAM
jgi:hypothetical protein